MARLHVLRVFVGDDGTGGNPLGVFLRGVEVAPARRQDVAAALGFSETVFVDDVRSGLLRIFTPATELPFAGHPLVGASWLLAREGSPVAVLSPPAGRVSTWHDDRLTWIRGRPEWAPPMRLIQLDSPDHVDALRTAPADAEFVYAWAWEDAARGQVRARAFAQAVGITEDEATGAAALRLAALVQRTLSIRQGAGSRLLARPADDGQAEVGGAVALDEIRTMAL